MKRLEQELAGRALVGANVEVREIGLERLNATIMRSESGIGTKNAEGACLDDIAGVFARTDRIFEADAELYSMYSAWKRVLHR
ncbi:hypothetical protein D3H35_16820 [Cohnella faecalis]|uniref:Uncharacterized protein n=1 Tax=Cohnella faecalis TaxID=2315694 RepID=A0A398CRC5_9BACL|nr:hypothetical protein D3H35_16820 [Cohnella faecalis]